MLQVKLTQNIYASKLKSRAVLVMNYLIYRSNKENTCFPAIKTIAKEVHVSVNTVKRALDDLVEAGFVKKDARFVKEKNGAQTSNLYTLCEVKVEPESDADECLQSVSAAEENNVSEHSSYQDEVCCQISIKPFTPSMCAQNNWVTPQPIMIPP